ncbi:MAG TPA: type II secretion system minor pseudopilin GspI [Steroidobacteraceae bacterium]|jgi:general secretion pathway protein I|nr:type II secretion system minor pseudopilin GspI [Steroidobacteraceae bacterium]
MSRAAARMSRGTEGLARGFTLVEVLVALTIVALGLGALMVAVNGTARTSGYLRDKTVAQWIALNRLSEVRLNINKFGQNTDTGELDFANRKWHYDTRYFDTSVGTMKRVVVRVYSGDAKTKGNPIAQSIGFLGNSLSTPGFSNVDWTQGSLPAPPTATPGAGTTTPGTNPVNPGNGTIGGGTTINPSPTPIQPTPPIRP